MNTKYFKNLIMGNVFRTQTGTPLPEVYYIGLSSTAPSDDGTNVTEPSSSTNYKRAKLTSLTSPDNGVITNLANINFPTSDADRFPAVSPAQYYVIYDAPSGGNLLMYNKLTTSRTIESDTVATIKAGSLYLQLTD